jgi:hypothetical protein
LPDDVGEKARLRVMAGSLGNDKTFGSKDDEFEQVIRFMEEINAVVVEKPAADDYFFL